MDALGDQLTLDVRFSGAAPQTVELYLDGALVAKRQFGASKDRGIISFIIETMRLTEGAHKVQVKAFGLDGKPAIVTGNVTIPGADLNAPVRISYPQNGLQVSGMVPIQVKLDGELQKQKPYVTFFVDRQLQVLKNFPPYEYVWDSTKVPNGWHVIEAWMAPEGSSNITKARAINVNVNNPNGETKRQNDVEDLNATKPEPVNNTTKPMPLPGDATVGAPSVNPSVEATKGTAVRGVNGAVAGGSVRSMEPSLGSRGVATIPGLSAGKIVGSKTHAVRTDAEAHMMGGSVRQPTYRMAKNTELPKGALPAVSNEAVSITPVIGPLQATETMTVQPGDSLNRIARRTGIPAAQIAKINNMPKAASLHAGQELTVPYKGKFNIAFDGQQIAFDVQPYISGGLFLTPFRQIFEHTGGRLYWYGDVHKVKAVNDKREVELTIGNKEAKVNNQFISLQRAPHILGGRTIVPASFFKDALDVNVQFDSKSGRLLIRSNK
jgi:LysM repeat protein